MPVDNMKAKGRNKTQQAALARWHNNDCIRHCHSHVGRGGRNCGWSHLNYVCVLLETEVTSTSSKSSTFAYPIFDQALGFQVSRGIETSLYSVFRRKIPRISGIGPLRSSQRLIKTISSLAKCIFFENVLNFGSWPTSNIRWLYECKVIWINALSTPWSFGGIMSWTLHST